MKKKINKPARNRGAFEKYLTDSIHAIIIVFFSTIPTFKGYSQSKDFDKTIVVDNITRQYLVHLPPGYNTSKAWPVIFALHGGGGTYKNTIGLYELNAPADSNGFIVVYPNAIEKAWSMEGVGSRRKVNNQEVDDVKFISTLIDTIISHYRGDTKRIYCTGISRGGIFSLYLAFKLNNRIAAIAPVCASIPKSIAGDYTFAHPISVLLINGTADPLIKYNGGYGSLNRRNERGGNEDADMLATDNLISKIASLNHCNSVPVASALPDTDPEDGCTAIKYAYTCEQVKMIFIKVNNGGHTWAGSKQYLPKFLIGNVCRDFSAADEVVQFFNNK